MFIEIKDTKGRVEILNTNHIIKIMVLKENGCTRINMSDGSYVVTKKGIDDVWEELYGI